MMPCAKIGDDVIYLYCLKSTVVSQLIVLARFVTKCAGVARNQTNVCCNYLQNHQCLTRTARSEGKKGCSLPSLSPYFFLSLSTQLSAISFFEKNKFSAKNGNT